MITDVTKLVDSENGLLDPRIYTDPDLYEAELEHVFGRCWLFLAHDTMIPKAGDFIQTYMARTRCSSSARATARCKAFLNQCRHRGMRICRADLGSTKTFTCTYHGWAYDIAGRSDQRAPRGRRVPQRDRQAAAGDRSRSRQVDYKGLIFGTWDPTAPVSSSDYLGDFEWYFDPSGTAGPAGPK